jgi:hypothetical protein
MGDETASGRITILDQRSVIEIETLRGRTPTEIYELLQVVCVVSQNKIPAQFQVDPKGFVKQSG